MASAQLEAAALEAIDQMKSCKVIRSTKADWRLVAAAQAMRSRRYENEFDAAAAMGKEINQRREVSHWIGKLEELSQRKQSSAPATAGSSSALPDGLLVQPEWMPENTPGIQKLTVAAPVVSTGKQHAKRALSAISTTPLGSTRATTAEVHYTLPPAVGERDSASKRRAERHWQREASKLRSLDLSGAAERHAAADAERQRVSRAREHEVSDVLDRVVLRLERQIQREARTNLLAVKPWRCPAGCRDGLTWLGGNDSCPCARVEFRLQCLPSPTVRHDHSNRGCVCACSDDRCSSGRAIGYPTAAACSVGRAALDEGIRRQVGLLVRHEGAATTSRRGRRGCGGLEAVL